jgi:hypothetical protein
VDRPDVVLVLDKSASMWGTELSPGLTRWSALHAAIEATTINYAGSIHFGAKLFPNKGATEVGVDACTTSEGLNTPIQLEGSSAILDELPPADSLAGDVDTLGASPAAFGLRAAFDALLVSNNRFGSSVIFVTDGAPNCNEDAVAAFGAGASSFDLLETYDQDVVALVADAFTSQDVKTFVVGIGLPDHTPSKTACTTPGSDVACDAAVGEICASYEEGALECNWASGSPKDINPRQIIDEIAAVGGGAKTPDDPSDGSFYESPDAAGLVEALALIADQLTTCVVSIEPGPPEWAASSVHVQIEGDYVVELQDHWGEFSCDGFADGWVYTDDDYAAVELCGTSCDELKQVGVIVARPLAFCE